MNINNEIAKQLNITERQVHSVEKLLTDGGTVPFISRYRKEVTGELDEVQIQKIKDLLERYNELEKRKASILKSMKELGVLTKELEDSVKRAKNLSTLEDIYMPFKPKRKTRGVKAKELGLEPLALNILKGEELQLTRFIGDGVPSEKDALQGASDIIAEIINEDSRVRSGLRDKFNSRGAINSTVVKSKKEEAEKYKDYYSFSQSIKEIPSHRLLAILRGVKEGFLRFKIELERDDVDRVMHRFYGSNKHRELLESICNDSYKRLLQPSLETEIRNNYKLLADIKAIEVFQSNLKELLLSAPLGEKVVLAVDPGLRTGCKIVVLNKNGALLTHDVVKPLPPHNRVADAKRILLDLCKKYKVEFITVGNGTGGREMEEFLQGLNFGLPIVMTSESGASIYSASECAREEFPNLDLTVRGAVSIGRRLMDPLAELVKIDAKSIGVGQYQHDVDQKLLKESLEFTVESCVNRVGVELNTASKELLSFVSGLNKKSAANIISYRDENGGFRSRKELQKVKGIGAKAYEQAAGFLRVQQSKNPLDRSGVHPERYSVVERMATDIGTSVVDLVERKELRSKINIKRYVSEDLGLPTLKDILLELDKPGRDPRDSFEVFEFDNHIKEIDDVNPGITVPGIVTNVTAFGAFVDIGVHQDGLVHISQLSDSFVKDPADIVKTGQKVTVKVLDVDYKRKRISLSMKTL